MSNKTMSIKVKNTEPYKDGQTDTIVCKGRLTFVLTEKNEFKSYLHGDGSFAKPIIISEDEIELGDNIYCIKSGHPANKAGRIDICRLSPKEATANSVWKKIIALPENFSSEQLQAIVDGKLKDGDEVYLQVEHTSKMKDELEGNWHGQDVIYVDNNNCITLFLVKKEESWDDVFDNANIATQMAGYIAMKKYLKENYNPPTPRAQIVNLR